MIKRNYLFRAAWSNITGRAAALRRERSSFLNTVIFAGAIVLAAHSGDAQQSYTFTTAGSTGHTGPTQLMVNTAYANTSLQGSVTIVTQGIQEFVVPVSGAYGIHAIGAQGFGPFGGRGADMYGEFQLTAGQVLRILVGQEATPPIGGTNQYGGGGGTFVTDASNVPLIVAGGGSWAGSYPNNSDATTSMNGNAGAGHSSPASNGAGGTNGGGGGMGSTSFGGGGLIGDGTGAQGGKSFINGGVAGTGTGNGGFGGGGGCTGQNNRRMGGGGGYSGGGGTGSSTTDILEGGGGGSFNAGTSQVNVAGINLGSGQVVITRLCNVNLSAASNPICQGDNVILSTNAGAPISWSNGSTLSSIVVSPSVTTSYSVTGAGTGTIACIGTAILVVSVTPLPDISVQVIPPVLCVGKTATITASGASSYTWSSGPSSSILMVNPAATSTYAVIGDGGSGCIQSITTTVSVNTNSLSASPATTICQGDKANISVVGAVTYTWSHGPQFANIPVSPLSNTVYAVSGTDIYNCQLSSAVTVSVNQLPNVVVSADKQFACMGEPFVLNASGAGNYAWTNAITGSASGNMLTIIPAIDVPYTYLVKGTDNNGCSNAAVVTVYVSKCAGIEKNENSASVRIQPNPSSGMFTVQSATSKGVIAVSDHTGRKIGSYTISSESTVIDLSGFAAGIYYVQIQTGTSLKMLKAVKE